jgi:6-phosphofructokinase 1
MTIKKIGIMTGGGDCPGLNPVIRGVVLSAIRRYGWEVLGIEDAFHGLIDLHYRSPHGNMWLTQDMVQELHMRGGTLIGTSNRADPFRFPVPEGDKLVEKDIFDRVLANYQELGLDALVSVGGDGSMAIAQKCIDRGMTNIVGVPKTIDNDLDATDYTFGFDTAVQVATEAIDRLRDTAESHDRVMLVEVMGRDAGWIALYAGIAGGVQAILIPEIPYRIAPLLAKIKARQEEGHPFALIVVAEGAKPAGGDVSLLGPREAGAMTRFFGAAAKVASALHEADPSLDIRHTVLGHIQRGGSPSCFDRILGTRFGEAAVELIAKGQFGRMVALRGTEITSVPMREAVGHQKIVDPASAVVSCARSTGIVFGDE